MTANKDRRDDDIRKLRESNPKKWRYSRLAELCGLSEERIRQICSGEDLKQKTAKEGERRKIKSHYGSYLRYLTDEQLKAEIERLSKQNRVRESVMQRGILIVYLKEKGFNLYRISKLLKRDHTSILHLYRKYSALPKAV